MSDVRTLRLFLCSALLAAAAACSFGLAPALGAMPCGEQVVNDWYGNQRVDKIFPLRCYREAIKSLPVDVREYSAAEEDILRALQAARRGKPDPGPGSNPPDDPPTGTNPPDDPPSTTGPGLEPGDDTGAEANGVDTSGPSSIPLPLFILGGLALLLLAAGAAGYLSRRAQARRGGPPAT